MAYVRKTEDVYDIQTNYGYGWETESTYYHCDYEHPCKAAKRDAEEYRMNGCQVRVVKRRERIS